MPISIQSQSLPRKPAYPSSSSSVLDSTKARNPEKNTNIQEDCHTWFNPTLSPHTLSHVFIHFPNPSLDTGGLTTPLSRSLCACNAVILSYTSLCPGHTCAPPWPWPDCSCGAAPGPAPCMPSWYGGGGGPITAPPTLIGGSPPLPNQPLQLCRFARRAAASASTFSCTRRSGRGFVPLAMTVPLR